MNITIEDKFQTYIKSHFPLLDKYSFLNELLFYGIFVYYYYFGPINDSDQNFLIMKYIIAIFVLRYAFNSLTNIKIEKDNKEINYYQLNSKLAIFIVLILFLSKVENMANYTLFLIIGYTLFSSAINSGYTVDNILTMLIVMYIYTLKIIT